MANKRSKMLLAIVGLVILQSILRVVFFYMATVGGTQLISPPPPAALMQTINAFSLALGVAGLLVVPGLISFKSWGYWGTLFLCLVTLVFDLWAFSTTAQTAAAGLAVPTIALVYLVPRRMSFSHQYATKMS